jgi:hypothetical protein
MTICCIVANGPRMRGDLRIAETANSAECRSVPAMCLHCARICENAHSEKFGQSAARLLQDCGYALSVHLAQFCVVLAVVPPYGHS